jgi:hypothetical protein
MEAQLTQLRCGMDGAIFDNPANLKKIESHFRPLTGFPPRTHNLSTGTCGQLS